MGFGAGFGLGAASRRTGSAHEGNEDIREAEVSELEELSGDEFLEIKAGREIVYYL